LLFGVVHDSLHIRFAFSAPIRLLDAFVVRPADLVVSAARSCAAGLAGTAASRDG
jgi:hypothetical protein